MDQVSTPPRSRGPQGAPASSGPLSASQLQGPSFLPDEPYSGSEAEADPGEDPYSPGLHSPGEGDPLAETFGALAGALLAMLTLVVPLLGVVSDRRDEPASSKLPHSGLALRPAVQAKRP